VAERPGAVPPPFAGVGEAGFAGVELLWPLLPCDGWFACGLFDGWFAWPGGVCACP
jgi:hypothetical protein